MLCEDPACEAHFSCRMRRKGIQVSPRATPTKSLNWKPSVSVPPAQNAEIIYSERVDGSRVPYLNADGAVIRHKEWREDKRGFASRVRKSRELLQSTPKE